MKTQQSTKTTRQSRVSEGITFLPRSLLKAAGLLRHKRKALESHQKRVRKEWRALS